MCTHMKHMHDIHSSAHVYTRTYKTSHVHTVTHRHTYKFESNLPWFRPHPFTPHPHTHAHNYAHISSPPTLVKCVVMNVWCTHSLTHTHTHTLTLTHTHPLTHTLTLTHTRRSTWRVCQACSEACGGLY